MWLCPLSKDVGLSWAGHVEKPRKGTSHTSMAFYSCFTHMVYTLMFTATAEGDKNYYLHSQMETSLVK